MKIKLGKKGQVVLPKLMRERVGLIDEKEAIVELRASR